MISFQDNLITSVSSNTTAGVTTTPLNTVPSVSAPFYVAMDCANANGHFEVLYVTSKTATNINHAATTYAHTTSEEVRLVAPSVFLNTLQQLPAGTLVNGKISVTVASNNLTVALKTKAGADPSITDPVRVMIADTPRTITSALSVTKNAGTNWCNAGSSELATKEIDYFVYLGYNATDGVVIGFSRIPSAAQYSDFSTTTTNEKYCAISTITNAASTDYYEVIGRFAATLSAGAGYTWSVPTFTAINLIQRPIYETRKLNWLMTQAGWSGTPSGLTGTYQLIGNKTLIIHPIVVSGTSNATTATISLPLTVSHGENMVQTAYIIDNSAGQAAAGRIYVGNNTNSIVLGKVMNADGGFTASGTKAMYTQGFVTAI